MPAFSLVVCVYKEGDLLRRLLQHMAGKYDDLVVVHDGPDTTGVREVVETAGGRFWEGKREYQQEPHWPFAWGAARHDWILRLDADELPSEEMQAWLKNFRTGAEPPAEVSGYTCNWPMWNGRRAISKKWPAGRNFLFNKQRVRFFGMVEQVPVPEGHYEALDLVLRHEPPGRKSHSFNNLLRRQTAWQWRDRIAHSLLGKPTDLACWRWEDPAWPLAWEQIRQRPWWTAAKRLTKGTWLGLVDQWRTERRIFPGAAMTGPIHHTLIGWRYQQLRRRQREGRMQNDE